MAVKFSEFTAKTDASVDVTEVVGYLTSGELNVRIPPANLDTTYVVSTGNAGASPTINLQGTKSGQAAAISPSTVSLTGSGATLLDGNGSTTIDFASTEYRLNADDVGSPGTIPVKLSGSGGGDTGDVSTVNLVGAGGIGITSSSNTITITDSGGSGGTVTSVALDASAFAAFSVSGSPITGSGTLTLGSTGGAAGQFLDYTGAWSSPAGGFTSFDITGDTGTTETVVNSDTVTIAGGTVIGTVGSNPDTITVNHSNVTRSDTTSSDSPSAGGTVDLVKTITTSAQGHITAIDVSTVTWPAGGGGGTFTVATDTGTGTNDTLALGVSPPSDDNVQLYIDGVYQSKGAYTVTGSNLQLDGGVKFPNGSAIEATTIT